MKLYIDLNANYDVNNVNEIVDKINDLGFDHILGFEEVNGVNIALTYAVDCANEETDGGDDPMWFDTVIANLDHLSDLGVDSDIIEYAHKWMHKYAYCDRTF